MKSIARANPLGGDGLMTGIATDLFSSLLDTSRAMIVTIIHRLEQTPSGSENIFTNVDFGYVVYRCSSLGGSKRQWRVTEAGL